MLPACEGKCMFTAAGHAPTSLHVLSWVSESVGVDVYISTVYSIPPLLTSTPVDSPQNVSVTGAGTPQGGHPRKKDPAHHSHTSSSERRVVSPQKTSMLLLSQSV